MRISKNIAVKRTIDSDNIRVYRFTISSNAGVINCKKGSLSELISVLNDNSSCMVITSLVDTNWITTDDKKYILGFLKIIEIIYTKDKSEFDINYYTIKKNETILTKNLRYCKNLYKFLKG